MMCEHKFETSEDNEICIHCEKTRVQIFSEENRRMKRSLNIINSNISEVEDYDGRIGKVKELAREGLGLNERGEKAYVRA